MVHLTAGIMTGSRKKEGGGWSNGKQSQDGSGSIHSRGNRASRRFFGCGRGVLVFRSVFKRPYVTVVTGTK